MISNREYFDWLLDNAFNILYPMDLYVTQAEHIFVEIIRLLEQYPALKQHLLDIIRRNLLQIKENENYSDLQQRPADAIPEEFYGFLAHSTRWPELREIAMQRKQLLQQQRQDEEQDESDYFKILLDALEDDWEDRDFYRCFNK